MRATHASSNNKIKIQPISSFVVFQIPRSFFAPKNRIFSTTKIHFLMNLKYPTLYSNLDSDLYEWPRSGFRIFLNNQSPDLSWLLRSGSVSASKIRIYMIFKDPDLWQLQISGSFPAIKPGSTSACLMKSIKRSCC